MVKAEGSGAMEASTSALDPVPGCDGSDARWWKKALKRAERLEREEEVLEAAKVVNERLQRKLGSRIVFTSKPLPAFPEPKRTKAHWDYLMDEMVWLAKEFQKERKWKQSQCRKFARIVERSKLDVDSRRVKREQQQVLAIRKKASELSKMVMTWWSKVERVVVHKQQHEVEKIEKHRLDKRLDRLVAKTEKCSKLLAKRVGTFMHNETPARSESMAHSQPRSQRRVTFEDQPTEDRMSDVNEATSRKLDQMFRDEARDGDYVGSDEEVDDETTIMEEERAAAREGNRGEQTKRELSTLKDENEMPIEEILKRYYASMEAEDSTGAPEGGGAEPAGAASTSGAESGRDEDNGVVVNGDIIFREDRNDTEYEMSEDEVDDEKTFAEEERLARKEGNLKQREAEELDALQKESEVPVEELLAQYRSQMMEGAGPEEEEAETPPRTPMTRKRKAESLLSSETKRTNSDVPMEDVEPCTNEVNKFKPPFLLKYSLREYQTVGLQWLAALRQKSLNGILADEMGLGKTIQTIALLADLACNHGYWGPHLIVVPTSVMLNWEMEFKKWCPAFKILTYYGTAKERQAKRQGWSKFNSFHVCITTYTLILQDKNMFRRKKWDYLILDEAHMIKNWQSQRWQTLLRFNARRRILLTGTPLQNNLMELWSLMHFLMPKIFESHDEFKEWFNNPLTSAVEGQASLSRQLVKRLHGILRPFILRRLKAEVEKKLPGKVEHIVYCKLSKRQRNLYEDYVGNSETQSTLASGNYFGVFNILMQLRKVCNHPDLFEGRAIKSAFDAKCLSLRYPKLCIMDVNVSAAEAVNLFSVGFAKAPSSASVLTSWDWDFLEAHQTPLNVFEESANAKDAKLYPKWLNSVASPTKSIVMKSILAAANKAKSWRRNRNIFFSALNSVRCGVRPMYTRNLIESVTIEKRGSILRQWKPLCVTFEGRCEGYAETLENFTFAIPKARAIMLKLWCSHPDWKKRYELDCPEDFKAKALAVMGAFHNVAARLRLFFPDRRLVQFDCGKLQQLAALLHKLKAGGHRVLIFTQMSKMLDILESFLNLYSYTYLRLDGATKPEQRQAYTQRFNTDKKIFAFILSTRSGGVGINLTGADTVIFYDSDWNPAMDHQAQDRCHRIGQTREVHIYRLVTKHTVEENIMKKSNQKRHLDHLAIQSGEFNVDFLSNAMNAQDLLGGSGGLKKGAQQQQGRAGMTAKDIRDALNNAEDDIDKEAAKVAEKEAEADMAEFVSEGGSVLEGEGGEMRAAGAGAEADTPPDGEIKENVFDFKSLEELLNPVDLYAIRFYENLYPFDPHQYVKVADVEEVKEAHVEADEDLDIQEFNEEDIHELNVVSEWDPAEARRVYRDLVGQSS
ncbi:P-loop-containing nucleoside triphosphate hydrolase [Chloropicon primus]|uniref:P-loop-containing nucleoside triphosphate hydrolase n=4 Tax=Chloropicon primus TaxID=1764295 RepID=A0A5B8MNL4_9CHLO|nr:P-loop-containing nucleoside triphosphate hydrolase [Chloropicon primus]|eukprot:QDZ22258.1 P-loop-containing nucleoside triphosphate hydrolase [Chloropicon primus]